jgi:hypothetical protein
LRLTGRPRADRELLGLLAERLTERDRDICCSLHEHRVLTATQLCELHFNGIERARKRLAQLHQLRVLERFRPFRQYGSAPYHYLLDQLGAQLVASERGLQPADIGWSRADALALATSSQLTHLVEANGFFTCLTSALCRTSEATLLEWWGQRRCARAWGELVRPDGHARLALPGGELELWVEWDRSTEPQARLQDKLDRYEELALALERPLTLLLVVPSERRERHAHQALQPSPDVSLLTTTAARHQADPLALNWLAPGGERRLSIAELARGHSPISFDPAARSVLGRAPQLGSSAGTSHPAYTKPITAPD